MRTPPTARRWSTCTRRCTTTSACSTTRTAAPDPRPPARRDPAVRRIPGRRRPTCDHGGMTSPTRFPDLPLSPALTPGLEALGYAELTPIQAQRSEEHTSELQSLMRNSYAVFCLKKKKQTQNTT